jgi:hypothetical protein
MPPPATKLQTKLSSEGQQYVKQSGILCVINGISVEFPQTLGRDQCAYRSIYNDILGKEWPVLNADRSINAYSCAAESLVAKDSKRGKIVEFEVIQITDDPQSRFDIKVSANPEKMQSRVGKVGLAEFTR